MRKTFIDKVLIEAAKLGDSNDIELEDLMGLRLVPCIIIPYSEYKEKKMVEEFKKKRKNETVIAIADDQAVFIKDGECNMIK